MKKTHLSAVALATAAFAAPVHAVDIYNNLGAGEWTSKSGLIVQGPDVNTISDVDQAARFTTGGAKYTTISIALGIQTTPGDLSIGIFTSSPTGPSSLLVSKTLSFATTGTALATATFDGLKLDANTDYWIVMDGLTVFDGAWSRNGIGATGVTAGRSDGLAWGLRDASQENFAFRVTARVASAVPGPAAALPFAALALRRRRKLAR